MLDLRRRLVRLVRLAGLPAGLAATGLAWLVWATRALAHGPAPAGPPDLVTLATAWTFQPLVVVGLAAAAIGWLVLVDRIDRRHPGHPVPLGRTVAFLAGLAVIAIALLSGVERYDTTLFSIHMVQHLLLMLVAAPLLALAAPITQLLRAAPARARKRWLIPFLHSAPVAFLSHPVTAWLVFTGVLWGSHFSSLFDLALGDDGLHDLEHLVYLGAGLLFWWPVVSADPAPRRLGHPARILYLLLQMPPSSFLAMAILFTAAPLYPHYAALGSPYGVTALADQQAAAGIMWVISDLVFIAAILGVVAGWMRHDERDAPAAERRADVERILLTERADRLAERRAGRAPGADGAAQPGTAVPDPAGRGEASSSR